MRYILDNWEGVAFHAMLALAAGLQMALVLRLAGRL